jgi:hypothetical protein
LLCLEVFFDLLNGMQNAQKDGLFLLHVRRQRTLDRWLGQPRQGGYQQSKPIGCAS